MADPVRHRRVGRRHHPVHARRLPAAPRWLVTQGREDEAEEWWRLPRNARDHVDDALPEPQPVPDEPAAALPLRVLLRPPMARRLMLFIAVWFIYYISDYGWLTLGPTLFVAEGYSLADSTTYLIVSGSASSSGIGDHAVERPV